jgi:DNA polymerase III subunit gamma/tau
VRGEPRSAARVAPVPQAQPPVRPATGDAAGAMDDWAAIVAGLGLQGPASQLAAHCVLVGLQGGQVTLRLDPAAAHFLRPQLEQKLVEALSRHYGTAVRLTIVTDEDGPAAAVATPARQQARAAEERQRAAEQAIESDANVRALREVFGATVQPGSVKPLN